MAGHELGAYAAEVLGLHACALDFESRGWVNAIDDAYGDNQESRYAFLKNAISWSRAVGDRFYGDASFHARAADAARSEEHTSELQSLMRISYAVFCLKKK